HDEVVELLIAGGFDPNLIGVDGYKWSTPALEAAASGSEKVLAVLFRHHADVKDDCDLLPEAASNGHASTVRYLISAGVPMTAKDLLRSIEWSTRQDHVDIVKSLLSNDLIKAGDDDQCSSLHPLRSNALERAIEHGALKTVRYLLESGTDVHSRTKGDYGETLLQVA